MWQCGLLNQVNLQLINKRVQLLKLKLDSTPSLKNVTKRISNKLGSTIGALTAGGNLLKLMRLTELTPVSPRFDDSNSPVLAD